MRSLRGRLRPMRVSLMSPHVSVERNAVAPIGKPMAFRHSAAADEYGDVDAGAGDGDFSCVDAIDGFGDGRARGGPRPRAVPRGRGLADDFARMDP
jgi:hypothetical protein